MHLPHQDLGIAYRGDADRANIGESQGVPLGELTDRFDRDRSAKDEEMDELRGGGSTLSPAAMRAACSAAFFWAMVIAVWSRCCGIPEATVTSPPLSSSLPISRC